MNPQTDFSKLNISHAELQAYLDAEREVQERAERAAIRAERDKMLEEREARMEATRKADAAAREAGDPNVIAAKLLIEILGDHRGRFMTVLDRASAPKFVSALAKLHREIEGQRHHAGIVAGSRERVAAAEAVVADRKVRVDGELARLGIHDVTPDEDEA